MVKSRLDFLNCLSHPLVSFNIRYIIEELSSNILYAWKKYQGVSVSSGCIKLKNIMIKKRDNKLSFAILHSLMIEI